MLNHTHTASQIDALIPNSCCTANGNRKKKLVTRCHWRLLKIVLLVVDVYFLSVSLYIYENIRFSCTCILVLSLFYWHHESPVEHCYGWISEMVVHMCAFCLATWCGWSRFFHHRLLQNPMSSCDNNRYCDLFEIIEKQSTIATITTFILAFVQCRRWKPRSIREQDHSDLAKS